MAQDRNGDSARSALEQRQLEKLNQLIEHVLPANPFYQRKLASGIQLPLESLEQLEKLPFTTKQELVDDQVQHPVFGTALSYPLARYVRVHQTSGTSGHPIYWLDTAESWDWWADCWRTVFEAAGVGPEDRIFFPFSFGPFIGFWSAWEGARKLGALAVSGGGQSTRERLQTMVEYGATVLVCTPTYALHMGEEARRAGLDLVNGCAVRVTIHAGEPGASIPATRRRIEDLWGARCFDHTGATEVGAFGFGCGALHDGVHVNEEQFIVEVVDIETGTPLGDESRGELVLTNLGRLGSPVIRYRTGDVVAVRYGTCRCGRPFKILDGGIVGRVDDMVVVRGINVFPSAVESVVREFNEVEEFRVDVHDAGSLSELEITVELRQASGAAEFARRLADAVRMRLELRPTVEVVEPGTLPRFELKSKRFFRH